MLDTFFKRMLSQLSSVNNKGFFHLLSANFFIQFVGFGSQFIVAWFLTPEELGQIKIMQTYLSIVLLFTTLGFTTSTLKLCSENRKEGEIVFIYKNALKYVSIFILIFLPLTIVLTQLGFVSNDKVIIKYFPFFVLAVIPWTLSSIDTSFLQAIKKIKLLSTIQTYTKLISVIIIVLLTVILQFKGYILGIVLSYVITFIFLTFHIGKLNKNVEIYKINNPFKLHWKYSSVSFLTLLVYQLSTFVDIFLMNYFIDDKIMIGFYSFAHLLILVNSIYQMTVQQISVPYISNNSQNLNETIAKTKKFERINGLISVFFILILYLTVPFGVNLVFGDKYIDSMPFYWILLLSWFFQNIVTFKGYTLLGTGKIEYNLITNVFSLILGVVFSLILMNKFGIIGLAYGKLITNFIAFFFINGLYRHVMNKSLLKLEK